MWEDLSPPPQVSGEGLQPISSVLPGCHGLPFSMKQLKPPSLVTGKQRGKQWDPALSLSSTQPGTFPRAPPCWPSPAPSHPLPRAAGMCMGRAQPVQLQQNQAPGDLPGFEARQEFYPGFWLPFPSKGFALVPVS